MLVMPFVLLKSTNSWLLCQNIAVPHHEQRNQSFEFFSTITSKPPGLRMYECVFVWNVLRPL
jgi:hypothetical protein